MRNGQATQNPPGQPAEGKPTGGRMEQFSKLAKTAARFIAIAAGAALAAKGTWEFTTFANSVIASSETLSFWVPLVPQGQVWLASIVGGGGTGAIGTWLLTERISESMNSGHKRHSANRR